MKFFDLKVIFCSILLRSFFALPRIVHRFLFCIAFPIYKKLHQKRAYGRVERILNDLKLNISAKDVFKNMYFNALDSYRLLLNEKNFKKNVEFRNEEILKKALASGPVVALSVHLGSFELLHRSLCFFNTPVHVITTPTKNKILTQTLAKFRKHFNLQEYHQVTNLVRALFKTKGILAMLIDQSKEGKGNEVLLFNKPSTLFLRLPLKILAMGGSIVSFHIFRENKKLIVEFCNFYPAKSEAEFVVKNIAFEVENWIKAHPEDWLWNYHKIFNEAYHGI